MEHAYTMQEAALAAAAQATEATSELLRFAREGEDSERHAFNVNTDVLAKLADALKLAIEIENEPRTDTHLDEDELALLADLKTATAAFLDGWIG